VIREGRPISEDDLHGYVDGVLEPERRAAVERHLAENPQTAARIAGWQQADEALRRAVGWKAGEPVPSELNVARIAASRMHRQWTPWRMAASILVALLVGAGAGWMAHTPAAEGGVEAVAQEAAMAQRVYAHDPMHPVEFSAHEQDKLVEWASQRLGRQVSPPDLSKSGYQLLGGRLVATDHGAGAMFLYQDGGGMRVTLFVRPMGHRDMNAKMRPVEMPNTSGFAWARNGLGFSLVAGNPMDGLHQLANKVRDEMAPPI
jgi:anti-sigma factor RsiW